MLVKPCSSTHKYTDCARNALTFQIISARGAWWRQRVWCWDTKKLLQPPQDAARCSKVQQNIASTWQMSGSRLGVFQEKTACIDKHVHILESISRIIKDHCWYHLHNLPRVHGFSIFHRVPLSRSKCTAKTLSGLSFFRVVSGFWSSMPWCE